MELTNSKIENFFKTTHILSSSSKEKLIFKKIQKYKYRGKFFYWYLLEEDKEIHVYWIDKDHILISLNYSNKLIFYLTNIIISIFLFQLYSTGWLVFMAILFFFIYMIVRASGIGATERIKRQLIKAL